MDRRPGQITISQIQSNQDLEHPIRVIVRDSIAGADIVTAELRLEDFARALTGLACTPCQIDTRGAKLAGTSRQTKTEWVPDTGDERSSLAPFEQDGWKAYGGGFGNSRRMSRRDGIVGYSVAFVRNVPAPNQNTPTPEEASE